MVTFLPHVKVTRCCLIFFIKHFRLYKYDIFLLLAIKRVKMYRIPGEKSTVVFMFFAAAQS